MIHFVVPREQEFGIANYLEFRGQALAGRITVRHYETLLEWDTIPAGTYILSGLDQLEPAGLALVGGLRDQLLGSGTGSRVLNAPGHTLLRLGLLEALHRRGLNRHRAVRASDDLEGLRYPVFLHDEHRHSGNRSPLLYDPTALKQALALAAIQGLPREDLLVIEFVDTADTAGNYRKYAAFVVGSEIMARSLALGRQWSLKHSGIEFTEAMLLEERAYVVDNPHERELRTIFELAGVEYGRIDYGMRDGVIETWEINLNPTIGRGRHRSQVPKEFEPVREVARSHFFRRFQAAIEAIDGVDPTRRIPLRFSPSSPGVGPRTRAEPRERWPRARAILRPFGPILRGAVRVLSPLIVRLSGAGGSGSRLKHH